MVTKLYLDTRRTEGNTPAPLKLSVSLNNKTSYVSLDIKVSKSQWDARSQTCKNLALNLMIQDRKRDMDEYIYDKIRAGIYDGKTLQNIVDDIRTNFNPKEKAAHSFAQVAEESMKGLSINTRLNYETAFKRFREYCDFDKLSFDEMTFPFIVKFDDYLKSRGISNNSRSGIHAIIKRIVLRALKLGYTTTNSYLNFSVKRDKTRHRVLTAEELTHIRDGEVSNRKWEFHRDMFMLLFYLIGINISDLYEARKSDVKNGRLVYYRNKTGKQYSILIQPEAQEIIDKYSGRNGYLIDMHDRYETVRSATYMINTYLKKLYPELKDISTYWARHTWATLAFRAGVSKTDVSLALGHSLGGSFITDIYIDYCCDEIVDAANRKVLDYIK